MTTRRAVGTAFRTAAHRRIVVGVTFGKLLKHPKVTYPFATHGGGVSAGALLGWNAKNPVGNRISSSVCHWSVCPSGSHQLSVKR